MELTSFAIAEDEDESGKKESNACGSQNSANMACGKHSSRLLLKVGGLRV